MLDVDEEAMRQIVHRLSRAQGQVAGVIRMIEEGRECAEVVTQLAAASRALDRAGFRIIASGLKHCVAHPDDPSTTSAEDLERLFLSLA